MLVGRYPGTKTRIKRKALLFSKDCHVTATYNYYVSLPTYLPTCNTLLFGQ